MRKKSKALVAAMCALVLALGVNATYAYLTDTTEAKINTFTVGNIDIELVESNDLNLKMVPGQEIAKDPVVTVDEESEPCWLFVKIDKSDNFASFMSFDVAAGWKELTTGSGVYYRLVEDPANAQPFYVLSAGTATDTEHGHVKVLTTVTKDMMDGLNVEGATQPTLTFTAFAVQKAGFDSSSKTDAENAAAAWAEVSPQQGQ